MTISDVFRGESIRVCSLAKFAPTLSLLNDVYARDDIDNDLYVGFHYVSAELYTSYYTVTGDKK